MAFLTVRGVDELKAAALLFKNLDAPTQRAIRRESAAWAPSLRQTAIRNARERQAVAIASSGRTTVTARGPRAVFGSNGRLRGGPLAEVARPYEFGTYRPDAYTTYLSRHRLSRRAMKVRRRTQRQIPRGNPKGRFIYPALAEETPRLVGRYVKAIAGAVQGAQ